MRERALETDSHQECIGSEAVAVVVVVAVIVVGGFGLEEVVDEAEEEGEFVERWFRWKSIFSLLSSLLAALDALED
jgi:hypothetical protein